MKIFDSLTQYINNKTIKQVHTTLGRCLLCISYVVGDVHVVVGGGGGGG